MNAAARRLAMIALVALAAACGRSNPALGEWEVDPQETTHGALLAVRASELESLTFDRDGASAGETEIPGTWVVEGNTARLVRADGRGEHRIEVVGEDRIRVELPIGVSAVYRRAGG